jgi:hypothetical protein
MNENIFLTFLEMEQEENKECINISLLNDLLEKENLNNNSQKEDIYLEYYFYEMNYNIKQLLMIIEYYGLKNLKKANKFSIIYGIIDFESKLENKEIVSRRKLMWFYMEEIKKDKLIRKYILF